MGKIRSIHPEACESEKLTALSDGAERTLWRLGTQSDDEGRGLDNPKLLAAKLYPLDDRKDADTIDAHLWELSDAGMVVRYEVDGKRYYEVHDFTDWQKPRHFTPSKLPPPSDGQVRTSDGGSTHVGHESDGRTHGVGGGVGGGGGVGEGGDDADASPPAPDDAAEQFDAFWDAYPRNAKSGKPGGGAPRAEALKRWRKLSATDREAALVGVKHYADYCARPDAEFPAHATTWLNQRRWEDWQQPAAPPQANSREPPRFGPRAVSTFTGNESFGEPKR